MRRIAKFIYVGVSWIELVALFIPIFVAGMALFVRNSYWSSHVDIGWATGWPILLLIITGLFAWIPRRLTAWLVALILLHTAHTILPSFKAEAPFVAAMHPVTAVLLVGVTFMHARRANQLLVERQLETGRAEVAAEAEPSPPT